MSFVNMQQFFHICTYNLTPRRHSLNLVSQCMRRISVTTAFIHITLQYPRVVLQHRHLHYTYACVQSASGLGDPLPIFPSESPTEIATRNREYECECECECEDGDGDGDEDEDEPNESIAPGKQDGWI